MRRLKYYSLCTLMGVAPEIYAWTDTWGASKAKPNRLAKLQ